MTSEIPMTGFTTPEVFGVSSRVSGPSVLSCWVSIPRSTRVCEACGVETPLPDPAAGVRIRIVYGTSKAAVMYCHLEPDGRAGLVATHEAAAIMAEARIIDSKRDVFPIVSVDRKCKNKASLAFKPRDYVYVLPSEVATVDEEYADLFACLSCRRLTAEAKSLLQRRAADPKPQTDSPRYLPDPVGVLPPVEVSLFSQAPHYVRLLARLPFLELCRDQKWKALSFNVADQPDVLNSSWDGVPIHDAPWPPTQWTPPLPSAGKSVDEWVAELVEAGSEIHPAHGHKREELAIERARLARNALIWIGAPAVVPLIRELSHSDARARWAVAHALRCLREHRKIPLPAAGETRMREILSGPDPRDGVG